MFAALPGRPLRCPTGAAAPPCRATVGKTMPCQGAVASTRSSIRLWQVPCNPRSAHMRPRHPAAGRASRAPERIPAHAALSGMQVGNDGGAPHAGLQQRQVALHKQGPCQPCQPCHAGRVQLIALVDVLGMAATAHMSTEYYIHSMTTKHRQVANCKDPRFARLSILSFSLSLSLSIYLYFQHLQSRPGCYQGPLPTCHLNCYADK